MSVMVYVECVMLVTVLLVLLSAVLCTAHSVIRDTIGLVILYVGHVRLIVGFVVVHLYVLLVRLITIYRGEDAHQYLLQSQTA